MHRSIVIGICSFALVACVKDPAIPDTTFPPEVVSPVVFDLDVVPYDSLSTYRFFTGDLSGLSPAAGLLAFEPITPLFSDYAHKSRYVWMPYGTSAQYVNDSMPLDLPIGAVLIKNFWYDNVQPGSVRRIIETRLMFRKTDGWHFACYVWNDEQTEAVLDMSGSTTPVQWLDDDGDLRNVNYRIPALAECHTCHKMNGQPIPIGPKARNLRSVLTYADGPMDQLQKWQQAGYLTGGLPAIQPIARWNDPTADITDRVRAYLDMNCAHCHGDERHCNYRPMRFAWHRTTDPVNLGVCVEPHEPILPEHDYIVDAGSATTSVLRYRINSTVETERMPLMGRTIVHEEAVQLIDQWIDGISPSCP